MKKFLEVREYKPAGFKVYAKIFCVSSIVGSIIGAFAALERRGYLNAFANWILSWKIWKRFQKESET